MLVNSSEQPNYIKLIFRKGRLDFVCRQNLFVTEMSFQMRVPTMKKKDSVLVLFHFIVIENMFCVDIPKLEAKPERIFPEVIDYLQSLFTDWFAG